MLFSSWRSIDRGRNTADFDLTVEANALLLGPTYATNSFVSAEGQDLFLLRRQLDGDREALLFEQLHATLQRAVEGRGKEEKEKELNFAMRE
jgi:hypothetical protein